MSEAARKWLGVFGEEEAEDGVEVADLVLNTELKEFETLKNY